MHIKTTKVLTLFAIVTTISLVTAAANSSSGGLIKSVFAVKSSKKDTSSSGGDSSSSSTTDSLSKFVSCVKGVQDTPTKSDVDNCYDKVFGTGTTSGGSK